MTPQIINSNFGYFLFQNNLLNECIDRTLFAFGRKLFSLQVQIMCTQSLKLQVYCSFAQIHNHSKKKKTTNQSELRNLNPQFYCINLKFVFWLFIVGNEVMDSTLIIFLALFFTFGVPCVIAFLIYYFKHIRKPLELAKMGMISTLKQRS